MWIGIQFRRRFKLVVFVLEKFLIFVSRMDQSGIHLLSHLAASRFFSYQSLLHGVVLIFGMSQRGTQCVMAFSTESRMPQASISTLFAHFGMQAIFSPRLLNARQRRMATITTIPPPALGIIAARSFVMQLQLPSPKEFLRLVKSR